MLEPQSPNMPLADRMKYYEGKTQTLLEKKCPLILRVDGSSFHTLSRSLKKPWDPKMENAMHGTAMALASKIGGTQIAYQQFDEISLLLVDYQEEKTASWFDRNLQKMTSISAAMASAHFSLAFGREGYFDSRAFILPAWEVCNYFIWRQRDAIRNSILATAATVMSPKQMHGRNTDLLLQDLLERGIKWDELPAHHQRGSIFYRQTETIDGVERSFWTHEPQPPLFQVDRSYIEKYLSLDKLGLSPDYDVKLVAPETLL